MKKAPTPELDVDFDRQLCGGAPRRIRSTDAEGRGLAHGCIPVATRVLPVATHELPGARRACARPRPSRTPRKLNYCAVGDRLNS